MRIRLSILGMAVGCAACGDGGSGDGVALRADEVAGFIQIQAGIYGFVFAEFFQGVTLNPDAIVYDGIDLDECRQFGASQGTDDDPVFTPRDAGPTVHFQSGATDIVAARDTADGISYFMLTPEGTPVGTTYDVVIDGTATFPAGTVASVNVPTVLELEGDTVITEPGESRSIEWSGAAGADFANISISDANGQTTATCKAKNDGAFTIPASATEGAASFRVTPFAYEFAELEGKTLWLVSLATPPY